LRYGNGKKVIVPAVKMCGRVIRQQFIGTVVSTENGGREQGRKNISTVVDESGKSYEVYTRFLKGI
jgi:hypothetical protein